MANIHTHNQKLWSITLAIWAACSLSFMVGMGIGSALFVLSSLYFLFLERKKIPILFSNQLAAATVGYFLAACISLVWMNISPPLSLPIEHSFELKKFHYFLLPFFAGICLCFTSGKNMRFENHILWKALYWMSLLVSVIGIFQFWGSYLFPAAWLKNSFFRLVPTGNEIPVFHAQGLMFFHLSFASALSFSCAYAWARVFWPLREDLFKSKVMWALLAILSSMTMFYTFSRISWVALPAILITLAFLKKPRWGFAVTALMMVLFILLFSFSDSMRGRLKLGWNSIFEREGVWMASLEMVKDRPLVGVGFGKTGYYSKPYAEKALGHEPYFSSHSHNNILDVLAATGVIGLLGFLAWWIVLWRYAWVAFRESSEYERWIPAACLAGFVAFQINGLTQVNFYDAKSQHALMLWAGIVFALYLRRKLAQKIAD